MTIEIEEISNGILLKVSSNYINEPLLSDSTIFVENNEELIRKVATLLGGSAFADTITFQ